MPGFPHPANKEALRRPIDHQTKRIRRNLQVSPNEVWVPPLEIVHLRKQGKQYRTT